MVNENRRSPLRKNRKQTKYRKMSTFKNPWLHTKPKFYNPGWKRVCCNIDYALGTSTPHPEPIKQPSATFRLPSWAALYFFRDRGNRRTSKRGKNVFSTLKNKLVILTKESLYWEASEGHQKDIISITHLNKRPPQNPRLTRSRRMVAPYSRAREVQHELAKLEDFWVQHCSRCFSQFKVVQLLHPGPGLVFLSLRQLGPPSRMEGRNCRSTQRPKSFLIRSFPSL